MGCGTPGPLRTLRVEFPRTRGRGHGTASHRHPQRALTPAEERRVAGLLGRLGITELAERRFLTLSYGERRLVLIARALASRPRLLLLDEVANGLDARNHARFQKWLASTARSAMPWVFATHRLGDVPDAMTHLLELERGRIRRAARACATRARVAQAGGPAFLAKAARARAPRPERRRVIVALRRADVFVDDVHILRGVELEVAAGECWVVWAQRIGKSTLLRTLYGDHAVASSGSITRAGHRARRGARKIQAAHGVRGAASPDLASTENAGDGGRCLGPLRQHRAQRGRSPPPIANTPSERCAALESSACASAPSRKCHTVRRGASCSRGHGRASRCWPCSMNPSQDSIAPRVLTWRAG